jgi:hypothetical protein
MIISISIIEENEDTWLNLLTYYSTYVSDIALYGEWERYNADITKSSELESDYD